MDGRRRRIKNRGYDNTDGANETGETGEGTKEEKDDNSTEIKNEIEALPKGDPKVAEGKIREINEKISALPDDDQNRPKLKYRLKEVAKRGLHEDLERLLDENGLTLDVGLILVLNHLTDKLSLAQYLYETTEEELSKDGLEIIRRKLGPKLEVLGGLKAKGINTSKDWVKKLVEKAPSFRELSRLSFDEVIRICEEPNEKEDKESVTKEIEKPEIKKIIENLIGVAKAKTEERDSGFSPDKKLAEKNDKKKKEDAEKLEQARKLMAEAEDMAEKSFIANKEELNKKVQEIADKLKLPPDWNKVNKLSPEKALTYLNEEISKFQEYIDTRPRYNSLEEVVAKVSGGLALTGILFSEYAPSVNAGMPILQPPSKVESLNTSIPFESRFIKFTSEEAAADFVKTVESSGFNIAVAATGFYGLVVGKAEVAYGSDESHETTHHSTSSCTSAAVTHHFRIGTQAFRIKRVEMMLREEAKKKALLIAKETDTEKQKDVARLFFSQYGSHIPSGVHNLGGIFFTIANVRSTEKTDLERLTHQAAKHLQAKVSFGFIGEGFGGGVAVNTGYHSESGETNAHQEESETTSYTYSLKSIGPNADSPDTFKKLLSNNNSTWAILERGPQSAYVPVWELFQELGKEYEYPASVMKETWREDESKKVIEKKGDEDHMEKLIGVGSVISLRTKISKKILTMKKSKEESVDIEYDYNESKVWVRGENNIYYPGKIERVDDKNIYVQFDDGNEDSYDLRDFTAVIPDLKIGKDNQSKFWGRWTNGLYYPGKIESVGANHVYFHYDDKDRTNYDTTDITAVVPDLKPHPNAVKKGTKVIGHFDDGSNKNRSYPGEVTEIKDQTYAVQLDKNGENKELTLEDIRLLPNGSSLFRVVKFIGNMMILKSHAFPEYVLCVEDGKLRAVKDKKIDRTCYFKVSIGVSTYDVHTFPAYSKSLEGVHPNDTPFEFDLLYK